MTRMWCACLLPAWGLVAPLVAPLEAQSSARWSLSVGLEALRFGTTAGDTVGQDASAVIVRPSARVGARAVLGRTLGAWTAGIALGFARGNVEAANDAVVIRDRTADLSRYRAGLVVERRLTRLGNGGVSAALEPSLDLWSLDGETRTRAGVQGGITLRLPLGRLELEQRVIAGVSASPLESADLSSEFELRSLRMVGFGTGVRIPL